ncbi:TetR/AcrR family transcriptional regulator [Phytomonospora endophytica]|uniref:AcrR family transcriptional regulator n=1 Tax=Phytomonospora endophytica TaxID=714109 RepID=A0A841FCM5_9ACTN|nr:TetR/AcrR family transcriptional regulator [Phytomonospora endophytica]MBB6034016.1 AcrR family transcriptional regulator [Phytomonospora endophytica]GIG64464.1 TetR family transcriptional regulator [Phytomonospora endophytica]
MPSPTSRKLRTDAARNREHVLDTASALFAARGDEVQMADVAREAGVGIGTVYRHFPTRRALIEATAERRFTGILDHARRVCLPEPDARRALACFLTHVAEVHERERALSGAIEAVLGDTEPRGEVGAKLVELGEEILARGRADGRFRADATTADLYMLVGAVAMIGRDGIGDWRRFIELALDGLRPPVTG